ncbi:MAG: tRNA epoxyqueuosine(34) reductase QueG [Prevotella sp.]
MNVRLSNDRIKVEARSLGFFACGVAQADRVDDVTASQYREWISGKGHASMNYLSDNIEKRLDPRLLFEGAKSIICVALNYAQHKKPLDGEWEIASYALGQDYHDIMKSKLHRLAANLGIDNYKACCDTAPVLERYWAMRAGLGWIGRNHQLIIPQAGSMFFLGELIVCFETDYDKPVANHCGKCHACIDACPTGALQSQSGNMNTPFESSLCLSFQTIENRDDIPQDIAEKMGNCIYGCDRCQTACQWNRFSKPTDEVLLRPKEELVKMKRNDWTSLTIEKYRSLFKGSAVKRAKYEGLMRNIREVEKRNEKQ